MRIGYSFWGFLGPGITDTPDGGRSHRRTLIDGLLCAGYEIVFLQANRDLAEAGQQLPYHWDPGLPCIDALFLEWRWLVPSRNDTECGTPGHTCDLHRQTDLVRHYTMEQQVPTIVWDKDQQLGPASKIRAAPNVTVCEPAIYPSPGAVSLLFPIDDHRLDTAAPAALSAARRDLPLVYIGNQYDRDEAFNAYFAPAAAKFGHLVAGKWPRTARWPHVNFTGRISFTQVERLYARSLATIQLAPDRYAVRGQFTQRLFEAVLAGCLPLGPASIRGISSVIPRELIVDGGDQACETLQHLSEIANTPAHTDLLGSSLRHLKIFRLSHQIATLTALLNGGP